MLVFEGVAAKYHFFVFIFTKKSQNGPNFHVFEGRFRGVEQKTPEGDRQEWPKSESFTSGFCIEVIKKHTRISDTLTSDTQISA